MVWLANNKFWGVLSSVVCAVCIRSVHYCQFFNTDTVLSGFCLLRLYCYGRGSRSCQQQFMPAHSTAGDVHTMLLLHWQRSMLVGWVVYCLACRLCEVAHTSVHVLLVGSVLSQG